MTKTFTQDDVIRFIYNETTATESHQLKQAMLCDAELQEEYKEMMTTRGQLDKSMKDPSDRVVSNIISYSKSLNLQPKK